MTWRQLGILAIIVGLVAGGTAYWFFRPETVEAKPPKENPPQEAIISDAPAYAYTTETHVVVMRGSHRLASELRAADEYTPIAWTFGGKYVAFLRGAHALSWESSEEQLVSIDVDTGEVKQRPCPDCTWIMAAPGRDTVIVDLKSGDAPLSTMNLASGSQDEATPWPVQYENEPVATTQHSILSAHIDSDGMQLLKLHHTDSNYPSGYNFLSSSGSMIYASLGGSGTRDSIFAVAYSDSVNSCRDSLGIGFVESSGDLIKTNISLDVSSGFDRGATRAIKLHDMWWDQQRRLHATIESWTCTTNATTGSAVDTSYTPPQHWMLSSSRTWTKQSDESAQAVRQLDDRMRVLLHSPGCDRHGEPSDPSTPCVKNRLELIDGDARTVLADGVFAIHTPPLSVDAPLRPEDAPYLPDERTDALEYAPVPSLCGHPAGTLVEGSLPGLNGISEGYVSLFAKINEKNAANLIARGDLTGDGVADSAGAMSCSIGGVEWPQKVVVYDHLLEIIGTVDLAESTPGEHAVVTRLEIKDGHLLIMWSSTEGAVDCEIPFETDVRVDGGSKLNVVSTKQLAATPPGC